MPKSRVRKGRSTVEAREVLSPLDSIRESPSWFAPVMVAAFLIGLFWIVVFYVSGTNYPIPGIKNWNMVVGFVFIGIGFTFATRWK